MSTYVQRTITPIQSTPAMTIATSKKTPSTMAGALAPSSLLLAERDKGKHVQYMRTYM